MGLIKLIIKLLVLPLIVAVTLIQVRLAAHVSKGLKSRIRPVVGRI